MPEELKVTLVKNGLPDHSKPVIVFFRSESGNPSISTAFYAHEKWIHVETNVPIDAFAWIPWITRSDMESIMGIYQSPTNANVWIQVTDALPRAGKHVLVYYKTASEENYRRGIGYQKDGLWYDHFNELIEVVEWAYWPASPTLEPSQNVSITPPTGTVFGEGF